MFTSTVRVIYHLKPSVISLIALDTGHTLASPHSILSGKKMKEAKDLAIRHMREIAANGPLTSDELSDLEEVLHLEFVGAKSRVGELQKSEFAEAYKSVRYPAPAVLDSKIDSAHIPHTQAITCSKCKSVQVSANRAGFGLGEAVVGGLLLGGVGLLAGILDSTKVRVTCLACGHSWAAGKA